MGDECIVIMKNPPGREHKQNLGWWMLFLVVATDLVVYLPVL